MIWALAIWSILAGLAVWWQGDRAARQNALLAALGLAVTLALAMLSADWTGALDWAPGLTLRAGLTPLAHPVAVMVPAVALAVILFAAGHEPARGLARLMGLMLIFTGAMEMVVIAGDLVTLLIGWEIMGAASWALIGHNWRQAEAMPSANYAFIMTRAGDLGLFLALFACFAGAGSVDFAALDRLQGWPLTAAAFGVLVAAAAKAGQLPFSPWLFRAMDGPTSVSALLHSSTMVAAGAYLVARLAPHLSAAPGFSAAAIGLGLATALAGGVVALLQMHAKKLLAGSTSAQLGLMFAAAGAGFPGVAILHLLVHAVFKAPLFFAAGIAHARTESFDLRRMQLGTALSVTALLTALAALALAGVPPLGGAWSKEEIVAALGTLSPWLALITMVAGGLSAGYATRFAVLAYGPGEAEGEAGPSRAALAALAALAAATLALSVLWWPPAHEAAARALGITWPRGSTVELVGSLAFVGLGLLVGLWLARHPQEHRAADWLGLPWLIDRAVTRPSLALASALARVDDEVLDALPRGAATGGRWLGRWLAQADDVIVDGITRAAAVGSLALSRGLSRADDHGIDGMNRGASQLGYGAVALLVRLTEGAATLTSRLGEAISDLIPEGTGRLMGMAGSDLRRLQTGLSHHYYVILVAGFAVSAAILIIGA